jgi:gliding motility-associated-like protein
MKTSYLKVFGKILLVLLFGVFFQNAGANSKVVDLKKPVFIKGSFSITDTPKQVSKVNAPVKDKAHPEDGIDDDILAREKQESARMRDPALHTVPVQRLLQARKIKDQILIRQASNIKGLAPPTTISTIGWSERGPNNVGGRTRALMFDLNDTTHGYKKVFAGGVGGGLWYTTDITATPVIWNKVNDFFENIAISCITQNPVNPQEIYVGTGEGWYNGDAIQGLGVWKSADGGATWAHLTNTLSFTFINSILVDKNSHVYVAGRGLGIMKSSDGGASWTNVISSPVDGADLQLAANGDIYASTGVFSTGNIFYSDFTLNGASTGNAGTWTNITPNTSGVITPSSTDWLRIKLACAPNNSNIVYAFFEGSSSYGLTSVQRYNKATNAWTVKTVPPGSSFSNGQAWYSIAAAVDPNNASIVYAGSLDGVKSIDDGSTWTPETQWYVGEVAGLASTQYVHADHHAYVYGPGSSTRLLMGSDGGIVYSSTATAANPVFIDKNHGYDVTQFYSSALHPTSTNYALAGAQDNGTQQYTTAGINATTMATGGDGAFTFIDQLNGNIQVTSYVYNNHWVSLDNGVTFTQHFFSNTGSFINPSDYDSNTKILYSGYSGGAYFRWNNVSSTGSPSTSVVSVSGFAFANITSVNVSPITANRVYFGLDNGTITRVDNANTGTSIAGHVLSPNPSVTASVSCVAVDPLSEDHLLVSYFNYGVVSLYETKNATAATPVWTAVEGNLPDMPVRWAMFYPGDATRAIIATELGVWTTDALNGASTIWSPSNSGLANVRVDMLTFRASDRTLAAATHGRGLFTTILPSITSSNAKLALIHLSSGTLSPVFAAATTSYTASVSNATTSITVTPTAVYPTTTITVNGAAVISGTASAAIPLSVGANTITVIGTAQDGVTTNTYTVIVGRGASNANLALIHLSSGTLSPVFAAATTSYTASVTNATTSITVTPTTSAATAAVTVNGVAVTSGTASAAIPLTVGPNTITLVCTAQDGVTTKTYTVTVTRALSTNANLALIKLSSGTLSPVFAAATTSYTASVTNATTSITVTPTTSAATATVTVNGVAVTSGTASGAIPLTVGPNTITLIGTAQDGVTTKTYTVTVTRAPSSNANLSLIQLSSGTLSPVFAAATTSYTASVPNATSSITVTPTTSNPTATVTVNGTAVTSGTASASIPLVVGPNTITVIGTAQDGVTTKTYTVTVTRISSNAKLALIHLSSGTLSPTFAPATTSYTASVSNATSSITVTPTAVYSTTTITVNGTAVTSGTASGSIALAQGPNTITLITTAQDGVTKMTYTVTVTRATGPVPIANNNFTTLIPDNRIVVHPGVSPNGDGINDILFIEGISNFPDNKLTLFNRGGAKIYETTGYDNVIKAFNGHSNITGVMQQPGTYFYMLVYHDKGELKRKTGYFLIKTW